MICDIAKKRQLIFLQLALKISTTIIYAATLQETLKKLLQQLKRKLATNAGLIISIPNLTLL